MAKKRIVISMGNTINLKNFYYVKKIQANT